MLNLQLLQRERTRLYKNDIRRQYEQKQQLHKNQSMQLKYRDQEELKDKIDTAIKERRFEKQREFYMNSQLQEENIVLASIKNRNKEMEQSFVQQTPLRGNSLLDTLYQHNERRGDRNKNVAKNLSLSYQQEDNIRKMVSKDVKTHELSQDQRHMERLKQMQDHRRQQYEQIKSKHSPQPKAGEMYKRLQQMNDDYRKSLQSFAYNGRDILDILKRDESKQIFQRSRRVQSELKYQMEEKKMKDQFEKQEYVGQPDDLKKSILGSILFKGNNFDKKQYADYLMRQMNQTDLRRSTQRIENKQKIEINSIFGGQGGPQRLKMIKLIDKNLGIESDYLKNIEPGNKSSSPYRVKNIYEYKEQNFPAKGTTQVDERNDRLNQNPQKSYTEELVKNDAKERKTYSSNEQTIKLSSSLVGEHSPKSYLGYDLINGSTRRYEY